jgi:DNA-binding transcriptional regulator YhcF (GntR family)
MDYKIDIISSSVTSKRMQIEQRIKIDIEKGILKIGTRLPSITRFSKQNGVARDTIEKAYKTLQKEGYITSTAGRGNYVSKVGERSFQILMVLNKLSSYKKEVFDGFIGVLGEAAKVDLQIHHYSLKLFKEILETNIGRYHYFVVMPHFFYDIPEDDYLKALNAIPSSQLIVLDKLVNLKQDIVNVFQDFEKDIFDALLTQKELFKKYSAITLVFPQQRHHPTEVIKGIEAFCQSAQMEFNLVEDINNINITEKQAYIALAENDLAILVKKIRNTQFQLGKDVGILSFNETILKELLGISVVSTDFSAMGSIAAKMILDKERGQVKNPFRFIKRESL